ncbi:hypothetical protein QL285_081533 [Trifolium repens]|nr:hypothetical protein QL285_081533 [Trifolium repens]
MSLPPEREVEFSIDLIPGSQPISVAPYRKANVVADALNPVRIGERDAKTLRNKRIPIVKVEWAQSPDGEFTWELESDMRKNYPYLF